MSRIEDMHLYLEECRDRPFAWSLWDCGQYIGGWIAVRTGSDPREKYPTYTDEAGARAILESSGGLVAMVTSELERVPVAFARRGDVVLSRDEEGAALGICIGKQSAHVGDNGLIYLDTLSCIAAWRVP
jgi:hypothetical protein